MMVMFATLCDAPGCGKRSIEWECWPSCRDCMEEFCPAHRVTAEDSDDEGRLKTQCLKCAAAEAEDAA